jgi:cysteine desulfurase / selenocysteine lyase
MLDERSRHEQFPSLSGMTYLNTAAEGISPVKVADAFALYFKDRRLGSAGRPDHMEQWESARALAGEFYGLSKDEVGICSCTSEAFNLLSLALRLKPGDEVIVNDLDFPAGRTPWLLEDCPATVRFWRAREGALRVEDLKPLLGPKTRLVSSSLVSYLNGFMIPLPAVVDAVRTASPAILAVDVTQALGRVPLDLTGVDFIVSSTHKWICASHGGGLVGIRSERAAELTPPAGGWFNLEDPFAPEAMERAETKQGAAGYMVGMPNFPAIYAIRAALEYIRDLGPAEIDRAARPLVHRCLEGLGRLPVEVITPAEDDALAGIVAFRHPEMDRLFERLQLDRIRVMHSAGRIRVAIHGYNTEADVEHLLAVLTSAA